MYHPGGWSLNRTTGEVAHLRAGEREIGKLIASDDFDVIIPCCYVRELVSFLDERGLIQPKMDNQSRAEDVKIINRLLDIAEINAKKVSP